MRGDPHVRFGGRAGETDRRRRRRRAPRPTLPIGQQRFPFPKTHVSGASSDREGTPIGRRGVRAPLRCRRGGRLPPESVDDLDRNQWTGSTGMGGRFHPEWSMAAKPPPPEMKGRLWRIFEGIVTQAPFAQMSLPCVSRPHYVCFAQGTALPHRARFGGWQGDGSRAPNPGSQGFPIALG